jgi:aryl-alcohol dehydrogenase-like predicted oxidoreductase
LQNGLLTGKYRLGAPVPSNTRLAVYPQERRAELLSADSLSKVRALEVLASEHGHTLLELSFGWLLSRSRVPSVIAGATSPEQVRQNVAARSWTLPADVLVRIDEIAPAWSWA